MISYVSQSRPAVCQSSVGDCWVMVSAKNIFLGTAICWLAYSLIGFRLPALVERLSSRCCKLKDVTDMLLRFLTCVPLKKGSWFPAKGTNQKSRHVNISKGLSHQSNTVSFLFRSWSCFSTRLHMWGIDVWPALLAARSIEEHRRWARRCRTWSFVHCPFAGGPDSWRASHQTSGCDCQLGHCFSSGNYR